MLTVNMGMAKEGTVISGGLEETGQKQRATGGIFTRIWRGSARTYVHGRVHSRRSIDTLSSLAHYGQSVVCRCRDRLVHLDHTPDTAEDAVAAVACQ